MLRLFKQIAVIGQSCRFPGGADSPEAFWDLLISGADAVTSVPPDRFDQKRYLHPDPEAKGRTYTFAAGTIGDVSGFDANYFGISAREAREMDPQQRLLLELTIEALERAGQVPSRLSGADCGVYVGISGSDYSERRMGDLEATDSYFMLGATLSIAANRLSHALDLRGPSLAIDTACSSSLAALHEAVNGLQNDQCSMAIVGAVNLLLSPAPFVGFAKAKMLAKDGRCRAFGKGGEGYVRAEGGGVVVLKPLLDAERDNDPILAVIRDVSINTNGHTHGIALPSGGAQEALLRGAYRRAHVSPRAVSYCEAHGTGTMVGDPAEASAIGTAIGRRRPKSKPLLIGSVKSNIGHLEPASGIAGIIKSLAILKHGIAPPTLHCDELNPDIDFEGLNIRPVREPTPLPQHEGRRIVGVNSFGFGGTNAHVILESYLPTPRLGKPAKKDSLPLMLSGRTKEALHDAVGQFLAATEDRDPADWHDIAYTAACRRSQHEHRLAVRADDLAGAREQLKAFQAGELAARKSGEVVARNGKVGLVFVGNGSQWIGMGVRLLEEDPVFRAAFQHVDAVARWRLGWSVVEALTAPNVAMDDTRIAQPLLFALQVALTETLKARGLDYDGVVGHSVGEVAAAYAAGALTLEQAVLIIRERSEAQALTRGEGRMMAAALGEAAAQEAIAAYDGAVEIAAVNSSRSVTLSGKTEAILELERSLRASGVAAKVLDLDFAFHSAAQDPTRDVLTAALGDLTPHEETRAFYSSVAGGRGSGEALTPDYWWHNVRDRVRFAEAVTKMEEDGFRIFVEVGPRALLQGNLRDLLKHGRALPTLGPDRDGLAAVEAALDTAYLLGADVDFSRLFRDGGRTVDLPTYPWQRERHWYEPTPERTNAFSSRQEAPLLGLRVDPHVTVWENLYDTAVMPFVADHRVGGSAIVPATAFIEMAFEAGGLIFGDTGVEIEGFAIHRPLVLDASRVVRFTWMREGGFFRIESREHMRKSPWVEHVTGRLAPQSEMPAATDVPVLGDATARVSQDEHYAFTTARGFGYGPLFQVVEEAHADLSGAVAQLRSTDVSGEHRLSPALLDGVLQTIFPILRRHEDGTGETFVPSRIGRIFLRDAAPDQDWSAEVTLSGRAGRSVVASGVLRDAGGAVVASLQDIRLTPVSFELGVAAAPSAFVVSAEPLHALTPEPAPDAAFAALAAALPAFQAPDDDMRLLDGLAGAFAADALLSLGEDSELSPAQDALFARLAAIVESQEAAPPNADEAWREALALHPHLVTELAILGHAGRDLIERLANDTGWSGPAVARGRLLDGAFVAAPGQAALLEAVSAFCAAWPRNRRLRVLDISDGGEDFLRAMIRALPANRSDLAVAERGASTRAVGLETADGLPVESLDLYDPLTWPAEKFDLIVGAQVTAELHDLHGLASAGATLLATRPRLTAWSRLALDIDTLPTLPAPWSDLAETEISACSVLIARAPAEVTAPSESAGREWRIVAGPTERTLAEALAKALVDRGQTASIVASDAGGGRIVHLAGLLAGDTLEAQATRADAVIRTLRTPGIDELVLVTGHGLGLGDDDDAAPTQALVPGLARVLANEQPEAHARVIDLHGPALASVEPLAEEIIRGGPRETVLADGGRFALRLDRAEAPPAALQPDEIDVLASTGGALDRLTWTRGPRRAPGANEVEVAVKAVGLNFRDVMFAMGVLPDEILESGFAGASLGMEAAGQVTRIGAGVADLAVGDHVACFATSALASHVITERHAVAKLPPGLSPEEGATMLTAFFTAVYSLATLARLKAGERILIHGAAGGVGIAALQYARFVGAEIFATAGNDEKRDFVALFGVDEDHILDSRSTDFAAEILSLTGGEGVDVVLNSLAGEAMYRGISLLKPFGRFIELGKVDFIANSRVGLASFRRNIAYHGVDADELISVRPDLAAEVLSDVVDLFAKGVFTPLPYRVFPKREVVNAFRHMQRARHIGKIVISLDDERAGAAPAVRPVAIHADAAYLVTGGLTGFGLSMAEWLANHGARRLILVSRSGRGDAARIDALRAGGVRVETRACDVTDEAAVRSLIAACGRDLRGVIHAAAVYHDGRLAELTPESLRAVVAPKAGGALALDAATRDLDLDLFLMLSSISSVIGNPGQANYVAANMVLEALAARRRSEGRAAQIIALAPIVDTGHLTSQDGMAENFERLGVRPLTSAEVFAKLDAIVLGGAPGFLIADVKWAKLAGALPGLREARFRTLLGRASDHGDQEIGADFAALAATLSPEELLQLLLGNVAQEIGQILRVPAEKLDTERSVFELGMDSLMGVELRMSVEEKFGVSLPLMALAQDVNIRGIAELIRDQLVGAAPAADDAAAGGDAAAQEHAQILSRHGSHVDADMIAETLVELEDKVQNRLIS